MQTGCAGNDGRLRRAASHGTGFRILSEKRRENSTVPQRADGGEKMRRDMLFLPEVKTEEGKNRKEQDLSRSFTTTQNAAACADAPEPGRMISDLSGGVHQGHQVDAGGLQFLHDRSHIEIGVIVRTVLTDRGVQEIIVAGIDVRLPVRDLAEFVGADKAVGKEIHELTVFFAVTAEMRFPGDSFDSGEAFKIDGPPVLELHGR